MATTFFEKNIGTIVAALKKTFSVYGIWMITTIFAVVTIKCERLCAGEAIYSLPCDSEFSYFPWFIYIKMGVVTPFSTQANTTVVKTSLAKLKKAFGFFSIFTSDIKVIHRTDVGQGYDDGSSGGNSGMILVAHYSHIIAQRAVTKMFTDQLLKNHAKLCQRAHNSFLLCN